ncbi:endonuclease [Nocardia panacis]|uniref:Endonuclease n=1 Tax=Nocardia panacis TaxID=2340916 RepID=A0A3A4KGL8_9NOCA|nr:endonuclease [Nocardia panacis]RJO75138.1 endonuclease [Nocardia panacis]
MSDDQAIVRALLDRAGAGYAAEAGITLSDKPAPLFQLLVLTQLLSHRIAAGIAVAAARELFRSGYRTPARVRAAAWQDLVDALGRGHFRRYDESTATALGANAAYILDAYRGDLRRLAGKTGRNPSRLAAEVQQFHGIGPVGADIFLREVQDVWTWVRPHFDERALRGAGRLHLPTDPTRLAALSPPGHCADLAAALVRADLNPTLSDQVVSLSTP